MKRNLILILALSCTFYMGYSSEKFPQTQIEKIPRPKYPRPQFVRPQWVNLNGKWTYTFDFGKSGKERDFANCSGFNDEILVPFCPESSLSGVNHKDFINAIWYQRTITIPPDWEGENVILHFGAVDYETEVFIDGKSVGKHWGGTISFEFDITSYVNVGKTHNLVVYVQDDTRSVLQPGGKQCPAFKSRGCHYTRTTGIWQTVWIEAVSKYGLKSCYVIPDLDNKRFYVQPHFYELENGQKFKVTIKDGHKTISKSELIASNNMMCELRINRPKIWSPENPFLYDILFEVINRKEKTIDRVESYMGMRKVHIEGNQIFLNNKPYYLRFVLDQGFYPDGIWTAPTDAALKKDIELSMKAGFNGARLHQKVFEERFHYWADKLGYLTWGESSSWGIDPNNGKAARNFLTEFEEIIARDRNHPSIIAWTPFNEAWSRGEENKRLIANAYELTLRIDSTRPVNDSSGGLHVKTDLWTEHTYEQDPQKLEELLGLSGDNLVWQRDSDKSPDYRGQPYLIDEYGGIKWIPSIEKQHADDSWGYGKDPTTLEEYYKRLEALTEVLLSMKHICGFCYTQLTDVEQEQNGIYNFDRSEKFDMKRIHEIFTKPLKFQ